MSDTSEILTRVKISRVYQTLTGIEPRRTGGKYRGRAAWRDGGALNVSMDDSRGVWHDFATGEGGGMVDLVARVRGGGRQDALKWLAELAGVPLNNRPLSNAEKAEWARRQRALELALPTARRWQRAAIALTEEVLDRLKAALVDSTLPWPAIGEIFNAEQLLKKLRRIDGLELIEEFRLWDRQNPKLTSGLVHAAKLREAAEARGLRAYVDSLATDGWTGVAN